MWQLVINEAGKSKIKTKSSVGVRIPDALLSEDPAYLKVEQQVDPDTNEAISVVVLDQAAKAQGEAAKAQEEAARQAAEAAEAAKAVSKAEAKGRLDAVNWNSLQVDGNLKTILQDIIERLS